MRRLRLGLPSGFFFSESGQPHYEVPLFQGSSLGSSGNGAFRLDFLPSRLNSASECHACQER
jgi:hypothetical protein